MAPGDELVLDLAYLAVLCFQQTLGRLSSTGWSVRHGFLFFSFVACIVLNDGYGSNYRGICSLGACLYAALYKNYICIKRVVHDGDSLAMYVLVDVNVILANRTLLTGM